MCNTCGDIKKKTCAEPFELGWVPGTACTMFFKENGFARTLDMSQIKNCMDKWFLKKSQDGCAIQLYDSAYLLSNGVSGAISEISAKELVSDCVNLEDLANVDNVAPSHCDMLVYHKGANCGVGCESTGDGWSAYTPPKSSSLTYVAGYNADGCLVKLDDPTPTTGDIGCRFLVHSGDTSSWQSIPTVADSTALKDVKMTADGCLVAVEQDVCANTFGPLVVNPIYTQAGNDGLVAISGFTNDYVPTKITPQWFNNTYTNSSECRMKLTITGRYLNCPEVNGDYLGSVGIQVESSIPSISGKSVIRQYSDVQGLATSASPATAGVEFNETWVLNQGQAVTVQGWGFARATRGFTGNGLSGQDRTSFAPNLITEANFGGWTMEVF